MKAIRVDGNDVFAVYEAVKMARELALSGSCPVLIEAMTYRVGHHSTSDDSTKYRSIDDMKNWGTNFNPVNRLRLHLLEKQWWDEDKEQLMRDKERMLVLRALETAEKKPKPSLEELFTDVYKDKPWHLLQQENELKQHIEKYPDHYSTGH
jgi:2-oxoisovalerate dehydrogenase E1 component alpha subunit